MQQEIIDKLAECCRHTYGTPVLFPCDRRNSKFLHSCKEYGVRYEISNKYVLAYIPIRMKTFITNFTKLSNLFGIPVEIEEFKIGTKSFVAIGGWWAKNKLRRELCRIVLKSSYKSFKDIPDFIKSSMYNPYFVSVGPARDFFENLKLNTEKQVGFRFSNESYTGFFSSMKSGKIKL